MFVCYNFEACWRLWRKLFNFERFLSFGKATEALDGMMDAFVPEVV